MLFNVDLKNVRTALTPAHLAKIGFGAPSTNDKIVREASIVFKEKLAEGGSLLLINGPASLPVAFAMSHQVGHLYAAIGIYDPKLAGYVISISHDPQRQIGSIVLATDVSED